MARIAGRNGRMYVNLTSGGTAEPLAFVTNWSIGLATDKFDVTAMGDTTKVYVAGLPDASGDVSGFYDNATSQLYSAAIDGVARKAYLYPDIVGSPAQYFFGTALLDFNVDVPVDGPVAITGSWSAASSFAKVG
jgi:hypothetical protein